MANPEFKSGPAIWKGYSGDMPIWLTGESFGQSTYDNRWYVKADGINSGIPYDEIIFDELADHQKAALRESSELFRQFEGGTPNPKQRVREVPVGLNKSTEEAADNVVSKAAKNITSDSVEAATKEISETTIKSAERLGRGWKTGRKAGLIIAGVVAAAGIADLAMDGGEKRRAKKQQMEQRKRQQRKDIRSDKYNYAGSGYQPDTLGNITLEMFNQRSGHHKMGNSKFY